MAMTFDSVMPTPVVPGRSMTCCARYRCNTSYTVEPGSLLVLHIPERPVMGCFNPHQDGQGGNHFFYLRQLTLGALAGPESSPFAEVLFRLGELWLDRGCRIHDDCRRNRELGRACQPHSHVTELWNSRRPAPSQLWGGGPLRLGAGQGRVADMTTHFASKTPLWNGDILTMECELESTRDPAIVTAEADFELRWHWTASP